MSSVWMMRWGLVALGGMLGVLARYSFHQLSKLLLATSSFFIYSTLFSNLLGAFLAGWMLAKFSLLEPERQQLWQSFALIGFLGGMTTFSGFCLEVAQFVRADDLLRGGVYLMLTLGGGLLMVGLGYGVGS